MTWFGWVLWHMNHCRLFNVKSFLNIYIKYIGFCLVGIYGISTIEGYLMSNLFKHIYLIYKILFGWVLWHINHCWLFNVKSFLNIYIKYIGFCLAGFYGISTIVGHIMPNPLYTNTSKYIWFGLVGFYGISTIVGYLMKNLLYKYMWNIYGLV